jgi:hypothetical protein
MVGKLVDQWLGTDLDLYLARYWLSGIRSNVKRFIVVGRG